ncbi:MAG: hypothetical protein AB7O26_08535 [Planctomycetaceae bacterium]
MYSILPGHGENRYVLTWTEKSLDVDILFDARSGAGQDSVRIHFDGVVQLIGNLVPGAEVTQLKYLSSVEPGQLGNVIEFRYSEAAYKWSNALRLHPKIRHFALIFLAENAGITVFAENCRLVADAR